MCNYQSYLMRGYALWALNGVRQWFGSIHTWRNSRLSGEQANDYVVNDVRKF